MELNNKPEYNPIQDNNSSIYDFIDRYKIISRASVILGAAIFIYCIYTNRPFEVIEFTGYLYALFVLIYVVGIDSLKDILDWWYKIQSLKKGINPNQRPRDRYYPRYPDYDYYQGNQNTYSPYNDTTSSQDYNQTSNAGSSRYNDDFFK